MSEDEISTEVLMRKFLDYVALGRLELVMSAVEAGVDIHSYDAKGLSSLHIAAKANRAKILAYLLSQPGANVHMQSMHAGPTLGDTPLHTAARSSVKTYEASRVLVSYGASFTKKNHKGKTAIKCAHPNNVTLLRVMRQSKRAPKREYSFGPASSNSSPRVKRDLQLDDLLRSPPATQEAHVSAAAQRLASPSFDSLAKSRAATRQRNAKQISAPNDIGVTVAPIAPSPFEGLVQQNTATSPFEQPRVPSPFEVSAAAVSAPPSPFDDPTFISLHDAVRNDQLDLVYQLLLEGCRWDQPNGAGETPADVAVSEEMRQMLWSHSLTHDDPAALHERLEALNRRISDLEARGSLQVAELREQQRALVEVNKVALEKRAFLQELHRQFPDASEAQPLDFYVRLAMRLEQFVGAVGVIATGRVPHQQTLGRIGWAAKFVAFLGSALKVTALGTAAKMMMAKDKLNVTTTFKNLAVLLRDRYSSNGIFVEEISERLTKRCAQQLLLLELETTSNFRKFTQAVGSRVVGTERMTPARLLAEYVYFQIVVVLLRPELLEGDPNNPLAWPCSITDKVIDVICWRSPRSEDLNDVLRNLMKDATIDTKRGGRERPSCLIRECGLQFGEDLYTTKSRKPEKYGYCQVHSEREIVMHRAAFLDQQATPLLDAPEVELVSKSPLSASQPPAGREFTGAARSASSAGEARQTRQLTAEVASLRNQVELVSKQMSTGGGMSLRSPRGLFDAFDDNRNGGLDPIQFRAIINFEFPGQADTQSIANVFQQIDHRKTGFISYQQFEQLLKKIALGGLTRAFAVIMQQQ